MADAVLAITWALAWLWLLNFGLCGIRASRWERLNESIRRLELSMGIGTDPELRPLLNDFLTTDWKEREARRWRYPSG